MLVSDVAVNLNVLGAFMEYIIMSNVDSTTIITIKRSGSGLWSIHISQEPKDKQAHKQCQQKHDTWPRYWNRKPRPASCYAMRQEKYPIGNKNLWWSINQSNHLPNPHLSKHGAQEKTKRSSKDHDKLCSWCIGESEEQQHSGQNEGCPCTY